MSIEIRLSRALYEEILFDLRRTHVFASERAGFVFGRLAAAGADAQLILLHRYHSIPDDHYVEDYTVGACIGRDAMSKAMADVQAGSPRDEGIFHIHLHDFSGEPGMSRTDANELPRMIPGFRAVGRRAPHGIVILGAAHAAAWVWLPGSRESEQASRLAVLGGPIAVFERGRKW